MKTKTFINRLDKFNKELADAIKETGSNEFFEVDTTIIGDSTEFNPITYKVLKTKIKGTDPTGEEFEVDIEDGEVDDYDMDEGLKYWRRMIKKTMRVWYSENPDRELEKDDDEDEED